VAAPGRRAHYSNVGYAVLGLVLERVAGCSYAEALRRNVLGPCAMTGSEPVTTAAAQARAPTGHLELPGGARIPAPWVPTAAGSGATLCTAADLGRFLRAVVAGDPPLLEPELRQAMLTPALPLPDGSGYGYGLGVEVDTEAGYRRVGHQGDCPGYCSYAYGCTETGVGVVALGNGPGGSRPARPAPGRSSTTAWPCSGRRRPGWRRPRTRRPPTPTRPPPRRRPPRPRGSFPAGWRHWSGPTPPGTHGPRSCGSAPTPPAPAWSWSGPPATRSP
jgi:CubicO group peptidase (beta-lactamase class C family)